MRRHSTAILLLSCWAAPGIVWAAGDSVAGVPLDRAAYGTGTIETLAAMVARSRAHGDVVTSDGRGDQHGRWMVPSDGALYFAHSGRHYVVNSWGDTRMAIGFPRTVDVAGAYFAGQGGAGVWARGVRAIGMQGDRVVKTTDW
ncbi:MAG TPA: hypothetical protein P5572_14630, partial [Phycisphaerae bacterium]|nr:hypothetical protein [Phycisphaerae bacterium]